MTDTAVAYLLVCRPRWGVLFKAWYSKGGWKNAKDDLSKGERVYAFQTGVT